jgi:hypothetical protein
MRALGVALTGVIALTVPIRGERTAPVGIVIRRLRIAAR